LQDPILCTSNTIIAFQPVWHAPPLDAAGLKGGPQIFSKGPQNLRNFAANLASPAMASFRIVSSVICFVTNKLL